jgi:predicted ATPase/DNA-binding SARP family transcriptional activator
VEGLKISLLGAPRITHRGRAVHVQLRKGVALLAYFAVSGQMHTRDALATMFWPENDQSSARANLRRALSRLRSEVDEQILLAEQDNVGMNPSAQAWLDVAEFQEYVQRPYQHGHFLKELSLQEEGLGLVEADPCPECMAYLQRAVELYQGDFMAGFSLPDSPAYDDWQFFQSENLRQALAECLQLLVRWHAQGQNFGRAIAYARRWTALDHLHEPAQRSLMRLYALDGQYAAAQRQYQECTRLLKSELGIAPEGETNDLYQAIRQRKLGPAASGRALEETASRRENQTARPIQPSVTVRPRQNLPTPSTRFVGRESELAEIRKHLFEDPACRLLTVLGPGGSGKTRLALEAGHLASRTEGLFPDGVWFVPLASLTEPGLIVSNIGQALGKPVFVEQDNPNQRLVDALRGERLLLFLDNFEHLNSPETVRLITEVIEAAPHVKILATSQARLNLSHEHVLFLGGLGLPDPESKPDGGRALAGAVELFVQCASRSRPDFSLDEHTYPAVVQICSQVQGMPLAIELAAGWSGMLSVDEIQAEVAGSFDFLEAEWRDLPERQRSQRSIFKTSWNLLSAPEQGAVKSLSTFRAGFSRSAAREAAGVSTRTLLDLINKCWIQRLGDERYSMHELLQQYAFETLSSSQAELRQAKERYCAYYADYACSLFRSMQGPQQEQAHASITREFDNLVTAWNWMISAGQAGKAASELLPVLFLYAEVHSKSFELLHLLGTALRSLPPTGEDSRQRVTWGILATAQGAFYKNGFPIRLETFGMVVPADRETIRKSWQLVGSGNLEEAGSFWATISAYIYGVEVDLDAAISRFDVMLLGLRAEGHRWEWAYAVLHREMLVLTDLHARPERDQVDGNLKEAYHVFQEFGDSLSSGHALRQRGNLRMLQANFPEAIDFWKTAQAQLRQGGDRVVSADIYWQIGDAYLQLGHFEDAFQSFEQIFDAYKQLGYLGWAAAVKSKESFEALRYSDLEHALRTREESLAIALQVQDKFVESWSSWEMGEIFRVMGDLLQARTWYEKAHVLFEKREDSTGMTFYQRGLGDIALAEGRWEEACTYFELSLASARATKHDWGQAYALAGLGKAETGMLRHERVEAWYKEALALARKTGDKGVTLVVLGGLAGFYEASGQNRQAVRLSAHVAHHYSAWRETREQAARLLEESSAHCDPREAAVLKAEGQALDVWEAVEVALPPREGTPSYQAPTKRH